MELHHFAYQLRRRWTHLRCEGSKGSEGSEEKVDGASPRGFLRFLSLTGPSAPRVVDFRSAAMLIKSALRDWLSASYGIVSTTVISHLRWLSPLWWLAPPPFPRKRGHYKAPLCCELLMKGLLCGALLSHRTAGGRWCRKAPKGDCIFSPVRAAVWFSLLPQGSIYTGAHKGAHHNPHAKGASNLSPLRTFGPAGRQPSC